MGNDWEPWAKIALAFGFGGGSIAAGLRLLSRNFSAERVQLARDGGEVRGVTSLQKALDQSEKREGELRTERDEYYAKWKACEARVDLQDDTIRTLHVTANDLRRELEVLRQQRYRPADNGLN